MNTNKNDGNKITDWTIGECCTKATGVVLSHFRGTAAEVQILLLKMVKQLKSNDPKEYVHGTETVKELTYCHGEYTAAAVFWSYEVDITAKETCYIEEITDKYVAGNFEATDEKMQTLKKGLKSNPEALKDFLGVKILSLSLDEIDDHLEETISQMPEEELEKFYNKYAFSTEGDISHILTVSTGHITKETEAILTMAAHEEKDLGFPITVYEKGKYGFYLYVPDEIDNAVPVELKDLLHITKSMGCSILCLDRDGTVLPKMKYYNW